VRRLARAVGFALLALALCLPAGAVQTKPQRQAAPVKAKKSRHVELRIGMVPFNDPRNKLNTTAQEETSLRAYFNEVQKLYGGDGIDLDIKLLKGNYYQILQWMREGQLDGAVVSSFTSYLLTNDGNLALFPVTEFARSSSRAMFSVRGEGSDSPETALRNCLEAVQRSLKEPPPKQPCEFRFVSHLSTTGFIVPLVYIEEQFVQESGMSLPEQQTFWTRLLQWSRLELLHGVIEGESKAATSIAFTYMSGAKRVGLPLRNRVTNLADVLLLGCRRRQPGDSPKNEDERRKQMQDCAVVNSVVGALAKPDGARHWEEAGVAIQPGDGKGYVRTNPWSQSARDEFGQRLENVFAPRNHETALTALFTRWYHDGRYTFSIDEVIDVLKVDQVIRKAPRAALVLPGGGVRATYQSVILDHLYGKRIVNAGRLKEGTNGSCRMADMMPPAEDPRLVINGIAGTSGGALLGYFASRRDTSPSKVLTKLWIDDETIKTTPLDVFPPFGVLRCLSLILLVAVFAATSAVHTSRLRQPVKMEVPFWYTTFLSIIIIAAPFLLWRNARVDPTAPPAFEGLALFVIILVAHFLHSVSVDGDPPEEHKQWRRLGIGAMVGGLGLAIGLIKLYDAHVLAEWKRTMPALWTVGATVALIAIILGLNSIATGRGLLVRQRRVDDYREAMLLLLMLLALSTAIFGIGWSLNRVTPLEMTVDYWIWVFVAAIFSAKLIITAERVFHEVPLLRGIRFLSTPTGTAPFPYTPAVTLVLWGSLGVVVWLMFVAPALYSSRQGRKAFDDAVAADPKAIERVPLIVSMTGLGDDVRGYRSPPYRGDYYTVDERWCFVDDLQEKTSARLFRMDPEHFRDAVFASGSPFPIYPATKVQAEEGDAGLFVDGGYAHRVPIEAAGLVQAAQILVVENVARIDVPAPAEGFRAGGLTTNAAKALDFLFERSQTIDGERARSAVVATIYPDWSPPDPFLMDFRESVVQRLRDEGEKDLEGDRVARIESWGEPIEEVANDGT
jgi:predicted acylesterase/phospholipase RssA/ABC-type phosphate/phosphonate transport system substrate-binding protein